MTLVNLKFYFKYEIICYLVPIYCLCYWHHNWESKKIIFFETKFSEKKSNLNTFSNLNIAGKFNPSEVVKLFINCSTERRCLCQFTAVLWIRIQRTGVLDPDPDSQYGSGKNDQQKYKKAQKFLFLKCWMFSFQCCRLLL
jgi:hypothetical protein